MDNRQKHNRRLRRKRRIRAKVSGTKSRPRLSVHCSARFIYAQLVDDTKGETLVAESDKDIKEKKMRKMTKVQRAQFVGESLAKKAKLKKISQARFDRGGHKYHGRVKALAEGARKAGLKF